jgi:hypothetical protein
MSELDDKAGGGEIRRALREAIADREAPVEGLFERVTGDVRRERSLRGRLRSLPTLWRLGIALAAVLSAGAIYAVIDGPGAPFMKLGALAATAVLTVVVAFRPIHRPALPRWLVLRAVVLALALPIALEALGPILVAVPPAPGGLLGLFDESPPPWRCFGFGVAIAIPIVVVVAFLDRGARPSSTVLAAASAGLAGNLALDAHCRSADPLHLLLGHALVVVLYVAIASATVAIRRRWAARG